MYACGRECIIVQYLACSVQIVPTVIYIYLTAVFLVTPQSFHAVCDLATSQVSLFGTGKFEE